ncbi:MAG: hypothetical protein ACYC3H_07560 [Bellilinea sp.]
MTRRNGLIIGLILGASVGAYLLDYYKVAVRHITSISFDFTMTILSIALANLIFAGILVLVFTQIRKQDFTPGISGLMILLGLSMLVLPFLYIRPLTAFIQYGTFSGITASIWVIAGAVGLLGWGKAGNN